MEKKWVVVNLSTNLIVDSVVWDGISSWQPPEGCAVYECDNPYIGWSWIDGEQVNPSPEE